MPCAGILPRVDFHVGYYKKSPSRKVDSDIVLVQGYRDDLRDLVVQPSAAIKESGLKNDLRDNSDPMLSLAN